MNEIAKENKHFYDTGYQKKYIKYLSISLSKKYDQDILTYLDTKPNKGEYIKNLIRKAIIEEEHLFD